MKTRSDAAVVLFLFFLAVLYLSFLIRNELILCGPQQFYVDHPIRSFWLSYFLLGNIPWIGNAVAGGIPLWSDPNLGIFYPGNLLYLMLPLHHAWNTSLILHLFWGATGLYWLCRKFELPVSAALTGAFAYLFSGPALAALNSNEVLITASWLPWILGLAYFGLQQDTRRILQASVALAFQWFAGFTFIQAFTLLLMVMILAVVYFRTKDRMVFFRFLLLIIAAALITAVQWIPAVMWIPHSYAVFVHAVPELKPLPYLGWFVIALFLIGLRNKIVWVAVMVILLDWLVFGGSPILAISLAIGTAVGAALLFQKFKMSLLRIVPVLVLVELMIVNVQVPHILPVSQMIKVPAAVTQIKEIKRWNIHCSGTKSGLSPLAGLRWGLTYGTPPESGLMLWKHLPEREQRVEYAVRSGKTLELLRQAGIGYVISDTLFSHPELGLIKQKATKFLVHRLKTPIPPLLNSDIEQAKIRWVDEAPNRMLIESDSIEPMELTVYRNALPGWKCKMQNQVLPIGVDKEGWMKIHVPAGKNQLHLTYQTPGSVAGTILTALGTILVLAVLLL